VKLLARLALPMHWAIPVFLGALCIDAIFTTGPWTVLIGAALYLLVVYPPLIQAELRRRDR
jgi:hypothetical protein